MDEFVKTKLLEWGFTDLVESFHEQQVDRDVFLCLNLENLKELIPTFGIRIKFWNKYQTFLINEASKENELIYVDSLESPGGGGDDISTDISSTLTASPAPSGSTSSSLLPLDELKESTFIYTQRAALGTPFECNPNVITSDILEALDCEEGKLVIASYGEGKQFMRNKLCELVIRRELKRSTTKRCPFFISFLQ
ncbi:uncharacterized protein LOC116158594 [Photinus pyralis]|uniref:uncharacterized protein LOC116158594 n=1 Tax=Photinus pyralis TaxID=7054 RepID=UPI0012677168|nr:uncharacterized protein LOC116158594 [Photinus pyralis]